MLSGVMTTLDRYNVADSPVAFDSDYMVFVSPPPGEKSKAVAPYMPFNAYVGPVLIYLSCPRNWLLHESADVAAGDRHGPGVRCGHPRHRLDPLYHGPQQGEPEH